MFGICIFVGRLTADPELKQTPSNVPVCSFSIAVEPWIPRKGQKKTVFPEFVAWRNNAEFVGRYGKKGQFVFIVSQYTTRDFTGKDQVKRKAHEFQVEYIKIIGFTKKEEQAPDNGAPGYPEPPPLPAANSTGGVEDFSELDDDSDLPF